MKFTLAFMLVDLGDAAYKTMASEMIRSARRAFKDHDMTIVQITDNQGINHPDADRIFALDTKCEAARVCQFKGWMMAEFAIKNPDTPIIFCDVDIIWNNDRATRHFEEEIGLGLIQRDWPIMPFNAGLVLTSMCELFWREYQKIIGSMPPELQGWYADQLALSIAVPRIAGRALSTYDMDKYLPAPDTQPEAMTGGWACHFKGPTRKAMMVKYARMLDGGEHFEAMRPMVPKTDKPYRLGAPFMKGGVEFTPVDIDPEIATTADPMFMIRAPRPFGFRP